MLCQSLSIGLNLGDLFLSLFLFLSISDLGLFELLGQLVGTLALGFTSIGFLLNRRVVLDLQILFPLGLGVDLEVPFANGLHQGFDQLVIVLLRNVRAQKPHIGDVLLLDPVDFLVARKGLHPLLECGLARISFP